MPVPIAFKPSRGSSESYARVREQARLQVQQRTLGRPVYELLDSQADRGFSRLPEPSVGDVFLDLEGDPFAREGGREYLFGVEAPGAPETYSVRWAFDDEQERSAFEAVIDGILERWHADPGMHVYHFGHYEPAAMKRLMGRYATRADALDRLLRGERFVDLHAVVRHAVRAGVESYSIKRLEPFYAFVRTVRLDDAAAHMRAIEMALESSAPEAIPAAVKQAVEQYNRDDCRSARALRDWLERLRAERVAAGDVVPRPVPGEAAPPERVSELDAEVETMRTRLLAGVPLAAAQRDSQQQILWLLAYLIDWHRRESKAEWWEFFRLCELPEEELLDEPLAIAGLELVGTIEAVTHKKTGRPTGSVIDRYRYPVQDVEIRRKGKVKLQDGRPFGEVAALDREHRLVDIRKGPERAAIHPSCVFSASVVPTEGPQRSVMRAASAIADGVAGCAADLLNRRAPRLRSQPFVQRPDESTVGFAERIVTDLDDTALAIQGPPGAGKTYLGARMICRLVAAGRRVGVTAASHKVIRNLLDAVMREAVGLGVSVKAAHKVSDESAADEHAAQRRCGGDQGIRRERGSAGGPRRRRRQRSRRDRVALGAAGRAAVRGRAVRGRSGADVPGQRARRHAVRRQPGAPRRSAAAGAAAEGQSPGRRRRLGTRVPARWAPDHAAGAWIVSAGDVAAGAVDLRVHVGSLLRSQARLEAWARAAAIDERRRARWRRAVVDSSRAPRQSELVSGGSGRDRSSRLAPAGERGAVDRRARRRTHAHRYRTSESSRLTTRR